MRSVHHPLGFQQLIGADFSRQEAADLVFIVTDLQPFFVHDDRPSQQAGIFLNQFKQLVQRQRIQLDVQLLESFLTGGNDFVRPVFRHPEDLFDLLDR